LPRTLTYRWNRPQITEIDVIAITKAVAAKGRSRLARIVVGSVLRETARSYGRAWS
jgi:hypothetical protein